MGKWWWLDWPPYHWSRAEQDAVSQLGLATGAVFLLLIVPQFMFLRPAIGNSGAAALFMTIPTLIVSLLLARPISTAFWPKVIQAGDEKAAERLAKQDVRE